MTELAKEESPRTYFDTPSPAPPVSEDWWEQLEVTIVSSSESVESVLAKY